MLIRPINGVRMLDRVLTKGIQDPCHSYGAKDGCRQPDFRAFAGKLLRRRLNPLSNLVIGRRFMRRLVIGSLGAKFIIPPLYNIFKSRK